MQAPTESRLIRNGEEPKVTRYAHEIGLPRLNLVPSPYNIDLNDPKFNYELESTDNEQVKYLADAM